jgi:hypothetical protein
MLTPEEEKELAELEKQQAPQSSTLTPEEENELAALEAEEPSLVKQFGQKALGAAIEVGRQVDKYTGAPVRSAIGAAIEGENPATAYASQFGEDPDKAPSGSQLVQKVGVSDKPLYEDALLFGETGPSPADIAGLAVDVAADPLAFIPIGKAASLGARGAGTGLNIAAKTGGKVLKGSAAAADLATGTKIASGTVDFLEGGIRASKSAAKGVTNVLQTYLKPAQAVDFEELTDIAKRNKIDPDILPEAVEFGEGSFISRASRAKAEGPLGQEQLKKFQEAQSQISNAFGEKISKISGTGGPLSSEDAGALIKQGYDDGVDRFFNQMDTTYSSIAKQYPDLRIDGQSVRKLGDTIEQLRIKATKRFQNPVNATERAEAKSILQTIGAIEKTPGDFANSVDLLQRIGRYNFKNAAELVNPIDVAANRKIYGDLKEVIINSVKKKDPVLAQDLIDNNKALSEFFGDQASLKKIIGNKAASNEGLFKNLIINGDSRKIDALKSVLSPQDMQQLKASFIESITKRTDDGIPQFRRLKTQLENKSSVVNSLFDEQEIKEISELVTLGNRFGSPVLSSSGTGASNMFKDLVKSIPDAIVSDQVIDSMKAKARGVPMTPDANKKVNRALDSLLGLTNKQVGAKISSDPRLQKVKNVVNKVSTANPRSKASQALSVQNKEEK